MNKQHIIILITLGFFAGLSFGLWQVCKSKDKALDLQSSININSVIYEYEQGKKLEKQSEQINLPKIGDLK